MQSSRGVDENVVAKAKVEIETLFGQLNNLAAAVAAASAPLMAAVGPRFPRDVHQLHRLQPRMITLRAVTGSGRRCPACPHPEPTCHNYQSYLPARDGQVTTARASVQVRKVLAGTMPGILSLRLPTWALCWTVRAQRATMDSMVESSSLSFASTGLSSM